MGERNSQLGLMFEDNIDSYYCVAWRGKMANVNEQIKQSAVAKGRKTVEKRALALARMKIVYVAVNAVKPNTYNPNRQNDHDYELLKQSMREDGFTAPIVVQEGTNEIVDGEHRWRAARDIGITEIPVVFTNMTLEQMRISTLRHNRAVGSEDPTLATDLLRDLRELGCLDWAQASLGIDDAVLQKLLDDVDAPSALAGEEFTEAWAPSKNADGLKPQQGNENVSFTPAAKETMANYGAQLAAATTVEERVKIEAAQQKETYRLVTVFKDSDAGIVRQVLDPAPAAKILALCQARYKGDQPAPAAVNAVQMTVQTS